MTNELNISTQFSTRCFLCKKKSLIILNCLCKHKFCLNCRFPEDHKCSFNFKEKGITELTKNNPIISGEKISKI